MASSAPDPRPDDADRLSCEVTSDLVRCPECRVGFQPRRRDQAYCCKACNKASADRALYRALRLYRALYHWRLWWAGKGRINVAANLKFICGEIASWIREDRDAQRLPPPPHDHDADRGHQRPRRPVRLQRKAKAA